jgi:hypothetical protein
VRKVQQSECILNGRTATCESCQAGKGRNHSQNCALARDRVCLRDRNTGMWLCECRGVLYPTFVRPCDNEHAVVLDSGEQAIKVRDTLNSMFKLDLEIV